MRALVMRDYPAHEAARMAASRGRILELEGLAKVVPY